MALALTWIIGVWFMVAAGLYPLIVRFSNRRAAIRMAFWWPLHVVPGIFAVTLMWYVILGKRVGLVSQATIDKLERTGGRQIDRMGDETTSQPLINTKLWQRERAEACAEAVRKGFGIRSELHIDEQRERYEVRWTDHVKNAEIAACVAGVEWGYDRGEEAMRQWFDRLAQGDVAIEAYSEVPHVPPERPE